LCGTSVGKSFALTGNHAVLNLIDGLRRNGLDTAHLLMASFNAVCLLWLGVDLSKQMMLKSRTEGKKETPVVSSPIFTRLVGSHWSELERP